MLPAVGFAMLLKIMPVARYWYMLLIGFVLFAYLKVPLLGIALFGLAIAFMLFETAERPQVPQPDAAGGLGMASSPRHRPGTARPRRRASRPAQTRGRDLTSRFWRYFWSFADLLELRADAGPRLRLRDGAGAAQALPER